jgi:acetoin utilization deacetylase AcuC-like enzyme
MGFCLLANIPIATEAAKARHGLAGVAAVDWDVHHGNGTQAIFYDRDDVLTISIHHDRCFPPGYTGLDDRGEGAGFGPNLNVLLPAGSGHETYLPAIERIVIPALKRYKPDLIVVASGLDANAVDSLARQLLHSYSFRAMTAPMVKGKRIEPATIRLQRMPSAESRKIPSVYTVCASASLYPDCHKSVFKYVQH